MFYHTAFTHRVDWEPEYDAEAEQAMTEIVELWMAGNEWKHDDTTSPGELTFYNNDMELAVTAEGFRQNRFTMRDSSRSIEDDRDVILKDLEAKDYFETYCDWAVVRWHVCDHDESNRSGCGSWQTIHSHGDVPDEVPQ